MKKVIANLITVLGSLVALTGLIDTPLLRDQLPISFMLPNNGQASHQFFRMAPAESQGPDYLPYLLLILGVAMFIAGTILRRKLRGTAA
ncbi:hypothetical protein [Lysobacter solisilvae (ex Woo and Kim 2020)]|uniref:Uncharacterized protein n=1 Tax=Agrilutibacter terrestris TaxID=2865112 RepID=A0A7H0FVW2_9GAMM|nr:hypothetical protein [Lysobacter terrestris]QNP40178.1 hypothetical protein H8B22_11865 [Lysobacter terrestris]